ncbi:MAG: response regulator [Mariprofundaceae bacterium]|nr:response regulator [Mariprofundaceae bacterium]
MQEIPHILIVDDENIVRNVLAKMLHEMGFVTMQARNSTEAQQVLRQHQPDIILLDMMMPGVSSLEVLKSVRADDSLNHTAVILISGSNDLNAVSSYLEAGINDFLPKPFNKALLDLKINTCLSHMRLLHADDQDTNSTLEGFCRNLSHDLNNALTGIIMTAELLLMSETSIPKQEHIAEIIKSAEKVDQLIQSRRESLH